MAHRWIALYVILMAFSSLATAAPGGKGGGSGGGGGAALTVNAVKIDYVNSFVVIEGANLDPATAGGTIGGANLPPADSSSTDTVLRFPFTEAISTAVNGFGNYVITISTDASSFTLTAFIPIALVTSPSPPPPGEDCPCSTEWDLVRTSSAPNGFLGQTPYCNEDSGTFVTVQFWDMPNNLYWVLWTGWNGSDGYCELVVDGTEYPLTSEDQFTACANYLNDIVTVWGSQNQTCLF